MKNFYLIGPERPNIVGRKLPSIRQVLSLFFYKHRTCNLTIRQSSSKVIAETEIFWKASGLPTCLTENAIVKLEKLYRKWIKSTKIVFAKILQPNN